MSDRGRAPYRGHTGRPFGLFFHICSWYGHQVEYLLVTLGLITKQPHFIDGRQTSNRYSFRDLPAGNKGVEREDSPSGGVPPQPLPLNQTLTKKQMECSHQDNASPIDGVAYCRSCYLTMTENQLDEDIADTCYSTDG
jgi:hypothetical protein